MKQVQRFGAVLTVLFLLASWPQAAQPEPKKKPVPEGTAQSKAEEIIRGIYKAKYTSAKEDRAAARELAQTLLDEGKKTTDDEVLQFVAFREARDLAARAGDLILAYRVAAEM